MLLLARHFSACAMERRRGSGGKRGQGPCLKGLGIEKLQKSVPLASTREQEVHEITARARWSVSVQVRRMLGT